MLLSCPKIFSPGERTGSTLLDDYYRQQPECDVKYLQDMNE